MKTPFHFLMTAAVTAVALSAPARAEDATVTDTVPVIEDATAQDPVIEPALEGCEIQDPEAAVEPEVVICEITKDETAPEGQEPVTEGEVVEVGEEEVVDLEIIAENKPTELEESPVGETAGPEVERIDDSGDDAEKIFQTTSFISPPQDLDTGAEVSVQPTAIGGGTPESSPVAREDVGIGSDERAAEIDAKDSRPAAVKTGRKAPVALMKEGRVFLR